MYMCGLAISVEVLICTKQEKQKVRGESEAALYMDISNQKL